MVFVSENGQELGLLDAMVSCFPGASGLFAPAGDADLRQAVYAPEASYSDAAAMAIAALFPGEIDPLMARRLTEQAFHSEPTSFEYGKDILVLDLARGPSASAADLQAAFLAAVALHASRSKGRLILIADGSGSEGAALSEALSGLPDLELILLYPEGVPVEGIRLSRLAREGGGTRLVGVRGDGARIETMMRALSGAKTADATLVSAGPANPVRLASRIIARAAVFSLLRRGISGELYIGLRPGDELDLAVGLWSWRYGLPITGLVLPMSAASPGGNGTWAEGPLSSALAERFDRGMPGALRSLVLPTGVEPGGGEAAGAALSDAGGPSLDRASASTLAAAERALASGLRGHARIVVFRTQDPYWDGEGAPPPSLAGGLRDARKDAEIGSRPADLLEFLARR